MEKIAIFAIPALLGYLLIRALFVPMKWGLQLVLHGLCGFGCLWLLNSASAFTGIFLPLNPVTVLLSGILGIPGIVLVALLTLI